MIRSYRRIPMFDDGKNKLSKEALDEAMSLITTNEGFMPNVYQRKGDVPTAGYGFTAKEDLHDWEEPDARKHLLNMVYSYDEALRNGRIANWYNTNATDSQKAALLDLLHQGGIGRLGDMPKFVEAINSGNMTAAAKEFNFAKSQTGNRHNARYAAFTKDIVDPKEAVVKQFTEKQTEQPTDAVRSYRPKTMNVQRHDDPSVPRSISWTAAYPKELILKKPIKLKTPTIQQLMEDRLRNNFFY